MSPDKFKEIREKLGLTQAEMAVYLGVKTYKPVSHYETGVRTPSLLIQAVMSLLDSKPQREAVAFLEDLKHHLEKVQKSSGKKTRGSR